MLGWSISAISYLRRPIEKEIGKWLPLNLNSIIEKTDRSGRLSDKPVKGCELWR